MGNCLDGGESASSTQANTLIPPSTNSSSGWGGFSQGTNSGLVIGSTTGSSSTSSYYQNSNHFNQSICPSSNLHVFTFNDLKDLTKNFCKEGFLGEGGFGSVYRGWMDDQNYAPSRPGMGIVIAVKKLKPESLQGDKEWLAEVHFLGQLHHPNLVKLMGYCAEEEKRLLVYEYMPRGSLENHLFRRGSIFPWAIRMKTAFGAAKGLSFLHEAGVIYRDFKTSNILLDHEYNSKLSDFGLAKEGPTGDKTHVTTCVIGTYGYAAPEYVATGHLTMKSDVYSFGVVLLELVSGRRVFEANYPVVERDLVEWAWLFLGNKKKVNRLLDPHLEGKCCTKAFQKVVNLAHSCLHTDPKTRPSMRRVVANLEPLVEQQEDEAPKESHPF